LSETVSRKLASVSWDFTDAKTGDGPHSIHPYPAKFIPQIPRHLIELFHPGDSSAVLDPFCGSGTTLVEAMNAGLDTVGIDLNPIATLVSKVKTTPIHGSVIECARNVIECARHRLRSAAIIPQIPRIDHWFQRHVQEALAAIVAEINKVTAGDIADALRVALSSIIVRFSNQDSDTRYAAVGKNVTTDGLLRAFEQAVAQIATTRPPMHELFGRRGKVHIITKDILKVEPAEIGMDIGLVVTSPPYPNAYEYWLYHKYRMYWMGMDPLAVRKSEIGARPHYFKKNHQTEHDFERQMSRCFWLFSRVMRPGRVVCFVVGRSIIH
jgi:site-specific DNA-methyltransferase (cytosine-N4-specific)